MSKRAIIMAILAIGIAGVAGGYYMYNKPHTDPAKAKPEFELTSDSLFNSFEQDEKYSNQLYLDHILAVSGVIGEISESKESKITIVLEAQNAMLGGVTATLSDKYKDQAGNYSKGDRIKVKGRCTGMLMEVVLVDCIIMDE